MKEGGACLKKLTDRLLFHYIFHANSKPNAAATGHGYQHPDYLTKKLKNLDGK